jgi:hypothetical protein
MFDYKIIDLDGNVLGLSNTWRGAQQIANAIRARGVVCFVRGWYHSKNNQ